MTQHAFTLYVEGARDRGIIEAWSRRVSRGLSDRISKATVIMGGRQPERAARHFRRLRACHDRHLGLCILDCDEQAHPGGIVELEPGLHVYTWRRRHIESYLLVPDAIHRSLRLPADDARVHEYFAARLPPPGDEEALRVIDAKSLFAARGPLATLVGRPVRTVQVARVMHRRELHRDVVGALRWLRADSGGATRAHHNQPRRRKNQIMPATTESITPQISG